MLFFSVILKSCTLVHQGMHYFCKAHNVVTWQHLNPVMPTSVLPSCMTLHAQHRLAILGMRVITVCHAKCMCFHASNCAMQVLIRLTVDNEPRVWHGVVTAQAICTLCRNTIQSTSVHMLRKLGQMRICEVAVRQRQPRLLTS